MRLQGSLHSEFLVLPFLLVQFEKRKNIVSLLVFLTESSRLFHFVFFFLSMQALNALAGIRRAILPFFFIESVIQMINVHADL